MGIEWVRIPRYFTDEYLKEFEQGTRMPPIKLRTQLVCKEALDLMPYTQKALRLLKSQLKMEKPND